MPSTHFHCSGLHIYMIGVGIQQAFILLFIFFAVKFHRTLLSEPLRRLISETKSALGLLYTIYTVLILITVNAMFNPFFTYLLIICKARIIFRLCEYSQGLTSNIPNHEAYQYCLDSLPMVVALILLNVVHPGRVMKGKEGDIPGRKERKVRHIYNTTDTNGFQLQSSSV
jgi:hypothetical protein